MITFILLKRDVRKGEGSEERQRERGMVWQDHCRQSAGVIGRLIILSEYFSPILNYVVLFTSLQMHWTLKSMALQKLLDLFHKHELQS